MILLKNPMNASTKLSMNGKSPMISEVLPFVLRLSKDERRVFQQNLDIRFLGGVYPESIEGPRNDSVLRLKHALSTVEGTKGFHHPRKGH
jgi:hypothetical protein